MLVSISIPRMDTNINNTNKQKHSINEHLQIIFRIAVDKNRDLLYTDYSKKVELHRGISMKHTTLFFQQIGKGLAAADWSRSPIINIQRLYYVKGGSGYILGPDEEHIPFIPGKIYIFPYNYPQNFYNDPLDRIDHIYVDFFSTPPIISESFMVYDVPPDSPLMRTVLLLDSLLDERSYTDAQRAILLNPTATFENIADAPSGSREELYQTLYVTVQALLLLLSKEKEIPFSTDDMIANAIKYINRNYQRDITITELAREAGYHVNHFRRRFNEVMGISPYQYLRKYRLYVASELISNGTPLKRAAELVGYSNPSSLSRELKRHEIGEKKQ